MSRASREAPLRTSAPARANLLGNPSDLYGGAVLACSVPLRARVELVPAEVCSVEAEERIVLLREAADLGPRGDGFDLMRAVLGSLGELPAARVRCESEIPRESGLAGSTALLVALLRAVLAWRSEATDLQALAERARWLERSRLGVVCGWVDHYLCCFGGTRFVDFRGKEQDSPPAASPPAAIETVTASGGELPFLLAWSGARRHSGSVHAPIRERWERGDPEVVAGYRRLRALAFEGRACLVEGDWVRLGALMNENHAIQRSLGGSGAVNERLIEAALRAGSPGAKLAGAGHGGTIVALWTEPDFAPLEAALLGAGAASCYRPASVPGVTVERPGVGPDTPPW